MFQLNTTVVGLEQIAKGHTDHDLTIKWPVPSNLRSAADQSRHLVLAGILILIHSCFEAYLTEIAGNELLPMDVSKRKIICRGAEKKGKDGKSDGRYSVFERTRLLMEELDAFDETVLAFVDAATVWRNHIVHKRADPHMDSVARGYFNKHAAAIFESHAGIDVARMVKSLEAGSPPTLKEATTIVAFLIRTVEMIDKAFVKRAFASEELVKNYALEIVKNDAAKDAESWMRTHAAGRKKCRSRLRQVLIGNGLREDKGAEGPGFQAEWILSLATLSRHDFASALSLSGESKDQEKRRH